MFRAKPRYPTVFIAIFSAAQLACGSGSTAPAQSSPETVGGSTAGGGISAPSGGGGAAATGGAGVVAGAASGGAGSSGGGPVGMAGRGPLVCEGELPPVVDTPAGWAAVPGEGVETTTGGLGGDEVTASSREELAAYAASPEPLVIRVAQSIDIGTLDVVSNKTLVGTSAEVTLRGGLRIRPLKSDEPPVSNVIVRNLRIDAATSSPDDGGDGIHIERAHHVWIDHCEVFDASDGNTDVTHGSNWVTVSWTRYRYTGAAPKQDHRFSNLIGHSENTGETDRGRLKVTYHHVFWGEGVEQRMPRVRFGQVHVYNNYINAPGAIAAVAAGTEAQLLVEANHFESVNDAHFFHEGSTTAQIAASGNAYVDTTGKRDVGQGSSFQPPYDYVLDDVARVPCDVSLGAGPR